MNSSEVRLGVDFNKALVRQLGTQINPWVHVLWVCPTFPRTECAMYLGVVGRPHWLLMLCAVLAEWGGARGLVVGRPTGF